MPVCVPKGQHPSRPLLRQPLPTRCRLSRAGSGSALTLAAVSGVSASSKLKSAKGRCVLGALELGVGGCPEARAATEAEKKPWKESVGNATQDVGPGWGASPGEALPEEGWE